MKTFIIGEAGSNWRVETGNFDANRGQGLALIDVARDAGCDAVKFQVFKQERMYAPGSGVDVTPYELSDELIQAFVAHCDAQGIEFMASAFSPEDLLRVDPYVKRHKIASYEINHWPLLEAANATGKPKLISTGAATFDEIEAAWDRVSGDVIWMHCVACYPAPSDQLRLSRIRALSYQLETDSVGYSDHSLGIEAPVLAVAAGAIAIEKHFTLSRSLPGPDHPFALEPDELTEMVKRIRAVEPMVDNGNHDLGEIAPCEEPLRRFATRARYGSEYLRPGNGPRGEHP